MARTRNHQELIPRAVRLAVTDAVGGWGIYTVREIADLFLNEGFTRSEGYVGPGGQRRQEADAFHAAIDFTDPDQAHRYLRVVEVILDDHDSAGAQETRQRLLKVLARAEIPADSQGRLTIPGRPSLDIDLAGLPTESGIRFQLARLARLEQEPEEMIGAAKELVEATAKHVLRETGEDVPANADGSHLGRAGAIRRRPRGASESRLRHWPRAGSTGCRTPPPARRVRRPIRHCVFDVPARDPDRPRCSVAARF